MLSRRKTGMQSIRQLCRQIGFAVRYSNVQYLWGLHLYGISSVSGCFAALCCHFDKFQKQRALRNPESNWALQNSNISSSRLFSPFSPHRSVLLSGGSGPGVRALHRRGALPLLSVRRSQHLRNQRRGDARTGNTASHTVNWPSTAK